MEYGRCRIHVESFVVGFTALGRTDRFCENWDQLFACLKYEGGLMLIEAFGFKADLKSDTYFLRFFQRDFHFINEISF